VSFCEAAGASPSLADADPVMASTDTATASPISEIRFMNSSSDRLIAIPDTIFLSRNGSSGIVGPAFAAAAGSMLAAFSRVLIVCLREQNSG
jgi:hypothetical protein